MGRFLFKLYFLIHDAFERRFFYYACKFLRLPHPKNLFDYRTREFLKFLAESDRVADLGCGSGKLVREIHAKTGFAIGVDLNPPHFNGIDFVKMDVTSPGVLALLAEKRITAVTLSHVLEHLPDPVAYLKTLRPIGKVLVCVPSQENWRFQYKKSLGLDARTDPTHFREYTTQMLRDEAEKAGYRSTDCYFNSEGEIFGVLRA